MSGPTPGPWYVDLSAGYGDGPEIRDTADPQAGNLIATVHGRASVDAQDANANLIAAAPELADALRRLLEVKPNHNMHHGKRCEESDCRIALARAALAKVDGKAGAS